MKKNVLLIALVCAIVSCGKENAVPAADTDRQGERCIDASSPLLWHYYSFAQDSIVDTMRDDAGLTPASNTAMAARADWDMAVGFHQVRTNSGKSTSVSSSGGVCVLSADVLYDSVKAVPTNAIFHADTDGTIVRMAMPRATAGILARSSVQVFYFKLKPDFVTDRDQQNSAAFQMPPTYLPSPVYIFRSADGQRYYKLQFTNFLDASGALGKEVRFKWQEIK